MSEREFADKVFNWANNFSADVETRDLLRQAGRELARLYGLEIDHAPNVSDPIRRLRRVDGLGDIMDVMREADAQCSADWGHAAGYGYGYAAGWEAAKEAAYRTCMDWCADGTPHDCDVAAKLRALEPSAGK